MKIPFKAPRLADHVWQTMVAVVMETRGDWRRQVAEATGLPFSRVRTLRRLADGPLTLRELADALATDAPAATVSVNDLEARGLVARRPHPEDKRAKLVSLTPAGRKVLVTARSVADRAPEALAALSPDELHRLQELLATLRVEG